MASLTAVWLRGRWQGKDEWKSDGGPRGAGQLVARKRRDGVDLYYRYAHQDAKPALSLGPYDEDGTNGMTLTAARVRAGELAQIYRSGVTDLHGHIERQKAQAEADRQAAVAAERARTEDAQRGLLSQLLDAYTGHLKAQGKQAAGDAKNLIKNHVTEAHPAIAAKKASAVTMDDGVALVGPLVEAGKGRTADKLRSYLRAAYQLAVKARTDPSVPSALRGFGVTINPFASMGAMSQFNNTRERNLSATELGEFLRRLDALPDGTEKDSLQLLLYLGGQRPAQMLRARPTDVDLDAATITLRDGKGRRKQARIHVVPLVKEAAAVLKRRLDALKDGEPLFSITGTRGMRSETISYLVTEISDAMLKEKQAREAFQLRDLRRTCETQMASLRISSDIRAQLQSHGLGGVQARHYDRHEYALEKHQALEKWRKHLNTLKSGKKAEVTQLRGRAAK
ncbi:MAG TPA: tyrosine-type recombinase/integrase [Steroidobacteraceae bacterium]|nr:tyrosine-type recombinase/integrase [Steroidobacteraceae bacterium]